MTFWRLLEERGSNGFAAADLHLHLGKDWKTAPVQKARRMAEFIDDPLNPASALTVLEEQNGKIFVSSESHPLRAREVSPEEVELWVPDWRKISDQLSSALGFFPCDPRGEGSTRQIGNIHSRKLPAHAAMLRSLRQWPFTARGNHPEHTPRPTRRRSSAFKLNSKRSSRYQASRSEKKALNFIPSLSLFSQKNTGGTRTRRASPVRKRIEGWLLGVKTTLSRANMS